MEGRKKCRKKVWKRNYSDMIPKPRFILQWIKREINRVFVAYFVFYKYLRTSNCYILPTLVSKLVQGGLSWAKQDIPGIQYLTKNLVSQPHTLAWWPGSDKPVTEDKTYTKMFITLCTDSIKVVSIICTRLAKIATKITAVTKDFINDYNTQLLTLIPLQVTPLLGTCRSNDQAAALLCNAFDLWRLSIEFRIARTEVECVDAAFKALKVVLPYLKASAIPQNYAVFWADVHCRCGGICLPANVFSWNALLARLEKQWSEVRR